MIHLDFSQALYLIKAGRMLKRNAPVPKFINLDTIHLITREDILAEDWEVV